MTKWFPDYRLGWLVRKTQHFPICVHLQAATYRWGWLLTEGGSPVELCFPEYKLGHWSVIRVVSCLGPGTYSTNSSFRVQHYLDAFVVQCPTSDDIIMLCCVHVLRSGFTPLNNNWGFLIRSRTGVLQKYSLIL